jgi:hypothetical protein
MLSVQLPRDKRAGQSTWLPVFMRPHERGPCMSRRSIVHIDGFNFYYGAVRGTWYK